MGISACFAALVFVVVALVALAFRHNAPAFIAALVTLPAAASGALYFVRERVPVIPLGTKRTMSRAGLALGLLGMVTAPLLLVPDFSSPGFWLPWSALMAMPFIVAAIIVLRRSRRTIHG